MEALSTVADSPIKVCCAGRTDAGVHASAQVIHFDCPVSRPCSAWTRGVNTLLPDDISVTWAQQVPATFHARFSAFSRRYRYLIRNSDTRPGLARHRCCWIADEIDIQRMESAADCLLGEHDFSAFRSAACQSRSPFRRITRARITRREDLIVIDIEANAFLHHMVRNIVGALLEVGRGRQAVAWTAHLLASRDRTLGAATAPASGLYLVGVGYPEEFAIPRPKTGPWPLSLGLGCDER